MLMLSLATVSMAGGCGGPEESEPRLARRTIAVAEVPETPKQAAQEALPQINFEEAWQNVDGEGNLQSYELRGRNDQGKIREVRVSPSGEVLEME